MPKEIYRKFHDTEPDKIVEIPFKIPKTLTKIGKCLSIEYSCSHPSKFTEGTYRHDFKKHPLLATDGKNLYIIGKIKITKRGIEDK